MPRALIVEIIGDAKQFGAELDKAAGKTRQMGKVAGVAGLAIAGGLAIGLEKSVHAAEEAQVSTAKMDAAFHASGESAGSYRDEIDKAESSSRNLGFTNTDVRDSIGTLEIATHDGTKAIKDLGVAEDIARFKHIDLSSASKLLTMTMAGSTRAAKALGIQTQTVTTEQDKVKAAFKDHSTAAYAAALADAKLKDKQAQAAGVIELVSQKLHGQADAFANTAQGGVARMHAQTDALEENLGGIFLPILQKVTGAVAAATGWLAQHTTAAKILVGAVGLLGAVLLGTSVYLKANTAGTVLNVVVTKAAAAASKAFAAAEWLLNAALAANPIVLVVAGLVALGVAFYLAWTKSKTFRDIVTGAWREVKNIAENVAGFFTTTIPQKFDLFRDRVVGAFKSAKSWVAQHWPEIATLISGPFAPIVALATGAFGIRSRLNSAWSAIKGDLRSAFSGIGALAGALVKAPVNAVISVIDAVPLPDVSLSEGHFLGIPYPKVHIGWTHPFHIPLLAQGGIVTGPTLAMIGEDGPEAVIPLSRGGGIGQPIHVHVGPVYGTVDASFARTLAPALAAQLRSNGVPQLAQAIKSL